jgi:hypothetical protein
MVFLLAFSICIAVMLLLIFIGISAGGCVIENSLHGQVSSANGFCRPSVVGTIKN